MGMQASKEAYEKLIREDIDWLVANADESLERDHIIAVLRDSVNMHYPEKPNEFDPMAYVTGYSRGTGFPEFDIKKLVTDAPYCAEKTELINNNLWYVVYPFVNYNNESGWSYDVYYRVNGEWSDISRNCIYSGAHLLPFYETKEKAVEAAKFDVSETKAYTNPEYMFYIEHIKYVYDHRAKIRGDLRILGATVPTFQRATLGDLLNAWETPGNCLTHTCPECGGKSITVYLSGNPLSGSKSMVDMCLEDGQRFSTSGAPGGYLSHLNGIINEYANSGIGFKDAYELLKAKVEGEE